MNSGRVFALRDNFGTDRVLGHFGGGLEYRFTPHNGLFGEAGWSEPAGFVPMTRKPAAEDKP